MRARVRCCAGGVKEVVPLLPSAPPAQVHQVAAAGHRPLLPRQSDLQVLCQCVQSREVRVVGRDLDQSVGRGQVQVEDAGLSLAPPSVARRELYLGAERTRRCVAPGARRGRFAVPRKGAWAESLVDGHSAGARRTVEAVSQLTDGLPLGPNYQHEEVQLAVEIDCAGIGCVSDDHLDDEPGCPVAVDGEHVRSNPTIQCAIDFDV
jgi:hypothetical protein